MYKRSAYYTIAKRIDEPRRFVQVVIGPRQIGKSTVVRQVLDDGKKPFVFYSADTFVAIEVKSNGERMTHGMEHFRKRFNPLASFIVGEIGIKPETFLGMDLRLLFE